MSFDGVKAILKSTTIRALIVAGIAKLTGDMLPPDIAAQGFDLLTQVVEYVALAVAAWGRVRATEKLVPGGGQ